jgi:hypothetical protein
MICALPDTFFKTIPSHENYISASLGFDRPLSQTAQAAPGACQCRCVRWTAFAAVLLCYILFSHVNRNATKAFPAAVLTRRCDAANYLINVCQTARTIRKKTGIAIYGSVAFTVSNYYPES